MTHDSSPMEACRLCRLRQEMLLQLARLTLLPGREPLRVALGLAVPAIEAWYLFGVQTLSEQNWKDHLGGGSGYIIRRQLKRLVYGTETPSVQLETEKAVSHARRIAESHLVELEAAYCGFRSLARDIRTWP